MPDYFNITRRNLLWQESRKGNMPDSLSVMIVYLVLESLYPPKIVYLHKISKGSKFIKYTQKLE